MLRLREYKREDAAEILSWTKDEFSFYQWSAGVLGEYPLSQEQFHAVEKNMAFSVMEEEKLVGFFILRYPTEEKTTLRMGFVILNPKYRNQGFGKQMIKLGLSYAFNKLGASTVSLGVFVNNPAAYYCYKTAGFKEAESNATYSIFNEEWTCIEMKFDKTS